MKKVRALVITGYGINCEKEMALACDIAGADSTIAHTSELLSNKIRLEDYHLLAFPGGFSFGDELGAGKAFANRLSFSKSVQGENLKERLHQFVEQGKCIIGICNGFQLLVKLGLLPENKEVQSLSLVYNDSHRFESNWVHHKVNPGPCVFTRGLTHMYLPVRHAEGKLVGKCEKTINTLFEKDQVVLQYADSCGVPSEEYPHNPNGSVNSIAGICDPTGRVFGMMAHPEAALYFTNHPRWHRLREEARRSNRTMPHDGEGLPIFTNAIEYLEESL